MHRVCQLSWCLVGEAGGEHLDEYPLVPGLVFARPHPLLVQEGHAFSIPAPRVAAVRYNSQDTPTQVFEVECGQVCEGDEAILETPVPCVPPAMPNVMEDNCRGKNKDGTSGG